MTKLAGAPNPSGATLPATTPWPLPIWFQADCIVSVCSQYSVPIQVFIGMYDNETSLGTNVQDSGVGASGGAAGPFQFEASTGVTYNYPRTNTPDAAEFLQQAEAAAHYLHDLYASFKNWQNALAGYNAGAGGYRDASAQAYGAAALAFPIPANWKSALSSAGGSNLGSGGTPATPGGSAGAGGTGTLVNDSSGFTVGDSTNPDEDFWTAINRLAQERSWYVFSDGETLYLADGPDLMKQTPAMTIDRIANSGQISHLEYTFDNTAWQYAATHRKRRHTQRRTALAKVTSPVEGLIDYVCKIDEVRAGDVVVFANTGPGDGQWLVGDVRRSVFEVTSEITVVPALTPLSEGQLNPAGTNKNNLSVFATTLNNKGYTNPVGTWKPGRIDAGVDGTLAGNYVAPGDSKILIADASNSGWKGGGYIAGQFTAGSLKGKVWYVAEGVTPLVQPGASVQVGTPVARPVTSPYNGIVGNIETGWADPSTPSLPLGFVNNANDQGPIALAAGESFNRFLVKQGALPGAPQGAGVGVAPATLPPGYP